MRKSHLSYFKALIPAFCFVLVAQAFGQTNISGVINSYAAVATVNFCSNSVEVANLPGAFVVGKKVMIIQMKGAEVDASNTAAFGDISNYRGCGNYEINEIKLISGTVVEFKYALTRDYEAGGAVQLVTLEEYTDAVVNAPLTAQAWNGSTGGVLLLKANTLTLNDSITLKGKGFRGALYENDGNGQACFNNGVGGATDYYCTSIVCGAPKGEGIGTAGYGYGRGKNASGGGGGDDHNTGGGGGSNYGSGGVGGRRSNTGNFSCPGPAPGVGGAALTYNTANNKIFMGGGGGAGDGNNNEQTSGGNGGGIAIIMAGTLIGNNKKINANADDVNVLARSDGAGGGGGGGTVLLYVDSYTGNVLVNAVGGDGGILDNGGSTGTNAFCMGPGGGGGGGALWVKGNAVPANITFIDTGGHNGFDNYGLGPVNCPYGTTNGALSGTVGGSLTSLNIINDTVEFVQLAATACCDTTVCAGATVLLTATDTATFPPTLEWSNGATTKVITPQVFATTTFTLTVTDARGCVALRTVQVTVQNALPDVTICCDTTVCRGATVNFTTTVSPPGQYSYNWSSGENTSGITKIISGSQAYQVTVVDANGCSVQKSVSAQVNNVAIPLTVCCDTTVCLGSTVSFTASVAAGGQFTYAWSTGQNTASITQNVLAPQIFVVTVTDASGCSATATVNAALNNVGPPLVACCDTLVCAGNPGNFTATSTVPVTYVWSTGQTGPAITTPVSASTTLYVTATDANGCKAIDDVNANAVVAQTTVTAVPDTAIYPGQSVQLTASGNPAFTFVWSPVTGLSNSAVYNPVASPVVVTTYCVTVTDNYGCPASDCFTIDVIQTDIVVKVPDAFAPNGNDPKNHVFTLFPIGDTKIAEVKIYNRWGEVVFAAQGNAAWDGNYQGKAQPSGEYVCKVIYGSNDQPQSKSLTKDFLLIR